jgi:hypothetical protein
MKANEIFQKTAKGQAEVESRSNALSMKERRVLILVNGENNAPRLKQLSLCENIVEILQVLLDGGFIVSDSATSPQTASDTHADKTEPDIDKTETAFDISAREFMCNTLLTFANRTRVARLIEEIGEVESIEALKNMVKPWYQAISETPGGMYQADDLREEVNKMIADEEVVGLR